MKDYYHNRLVSSKTNMIHIKNYFTRVKSFFQLLLYKTSWYIWVDSNNQQYQKYPLVLKDYL